VRLSYNNVALIELIIIVLVFFISERRSIVCTLYTMSRHFELCNKIIDNISIGLCTQDFMRYLFYYLLVKRICRNNETEYSL